MGRPKSNIIRVKNITIHCSHIEYESLKRKAYFTRQPMSVYLRMCGLEKDLQPRLTDDEIAILMNLVGIANNLNQAVKRLNSQGDTNDNISRLLELVNELIGRLT